MGRIPGTPILLGASGHSQSGNGGDGGDDDDPNGAHHFSIQAVAIRALFSYRGPKLTLQPYCGAGGLQQTNKR